MIGSANDEQLLEGVISVTCAKGCALVKQDALRFIRCPYCQGQMVVTWRVQLDNERVNHVTLSDAVRKARGGNAPVRRKAFA